MANASIDNVTKTVETEVQEEVIQLTLSRAEARALWALTAAVYTGDSATDTYRRETEAVKAALGDTGKLGLIWRTDLFYVDDDGDLRAKEHLFTDK